MQASVTAVNTAGLYSPSTPVLIGGSAPANSPRALGLISTCRPAGTNCLIQPPPQLHHPRLTNGPACSCKACWPRAFRGAPLLTLNRLRIDAPDAHLQGQSSATTQRMRVRARADRPGPARSAIHARRPPVGHRRPGPTGRASDTWPPPAAGWPAGPPLPACSATTNCTGRQRSRRAGKAAGKTTPRQGNPVPSAGAAQLGWTQGADAAGKKADSGRLRRLTRPGCTRPATSA